MCMCQSGYVWGEAYVIALVTGGASCGKSAFAEQLCLSLGSPRMYLAAMRPFGEEGRVRVERHRALRAGKGFTTVECYEGLDALADDARIDGAVALLECLGNVVANELFSPEPRCANDQPLSELIAGQIDTLAKRCGHLVIVGNEVGSDGACYPHETEAYRRELGDLSRALARRSDIVVECVAGVPTYIKGQEGGLHDRA